MVKIQKIKLTEDDLKSQLKGQIEFLIRSGELFDKGITDEAKNMATHLRVLLHDARYPSLLTQLSKKDILFYDSSLDQNKNNPLCHMGLIKLNLEINDISMSAYFDPPLDKEPERYLKEKISFNMWWNQIILENFNRQPFTRKELILAVANTDGGAHVDSDLEEEYFDLTRENSLGIRFMDENVEELLIDSELVSIRQITHEVLKSLKDEFPELFINEESIKTSISQVKEIPKQIKNTDCKNENELTVNCLRKYLKESKTVEYWANNIRSLGIEVRMIGMISRDMNMLKLTDIETIGDLDKLLESSKGWGEKYLEEMYQNKFGNQSYERVASDRNGIVTHFLIANYPNIFTNEALDQDFGYGNPQTVTVPAKKYNPNHKSN